MLSVVKVAVSSNRPCFILSTLNSDPFEWGASFRKTSYMHVSWGGGNKGMGVRRQGRKEGRKEARWAGEHLQNWGGLSQQERSLSAVRLHAGHLTSPVSFSSSMKLPCLCEEYTSVVWKRADYRMLCKCGELIGLLCFGHMHFYPGYRCLGSCLGMEYILFPGTWPRFCWFLRMGSHPRAMERGSLSF